MSREHLNSVQLTQATMDLGPRMTVFHLQVRLAPRPKTCLQNT
jgi:hypothetical protein